MSENIIDILHRLSYQVDNTDIRAATTEIDKNIQAVKKLEEENKKLAEQIKKTSVHDTDQKTKLQLVWRKNLEEIERLKKSVSGLDKVATPASKSIAKMGESTSQAANTLRSFSYIAGHSLGLQTPLPSPAEKAAKKDSLRK